MNRELAESFVQYQVDQSTTDKKKYVVGAIGLTVLALFPLMFYHPAEFIIVEICIIIPIIIATIVYINKPKIIIMFCTFALYCMTLVVILNGFCFPIFKLTESFNLLDYIIFLLLQLLSFCIAIPFSIISANKHNKDKKAISGAVWSSLWNGLAAFTIVTARLWARLTNPSLETVLILLSGSLVVINGLLGDKITKVVYCVILIKKYNLTCYNKYNAKPEPAKTENELQELAQGIDKDETDEHNNKIP